MKITEEIKASILDTIIPEKLAEAMKMIEQLIPKDGTYRATYDTYSFELLNPPSNFNIVLFMIRLKHFVNTLQDQPEVIPILRQAAPDFEEDDPIEDVYDRLCKLDFKKQTTYFKNIYSNKDVSAVLLHGDNPNELRWIYNQLLHEAKLFNSAPVPVDYESSAQNTFEHLLQALYDRFQIKNRELKVLRQQIELNLQTVPLVIIVRYPSKKLAELPAFYKSFYELFSYLANEVVVTPRNKVIFLFVDNKLPEYQTLDKNYFLWMEDVPAGVSYSDLAINQPRPRIVDLAAIEDLDEKMIREWIEENLNNKVVKEHLSCKAGEKCIDLMGKGKNPYTVISEIYNVLKIDPTKTPDQWLKH